MSRTKAEETKTEEAPGAKTEDSPRAYEHTDPNAETPTVRDPAAPEEAPGEVLPEDHVPVAERVAGAKRGPTAEEVAKYFEDDPTTLLEAIVILANSDRYRRNGSFVAIAQHYQVEQGSIRQWQERIDQQVNRRQASAEAVPAKK
jgi:hypothetical protein